MVLSYLWFFFFFFQAEDGIRDYKVTGVQTCALPIWSRSPRLNHVSAPRSPIASRQRNVSPARPQPRAASSRPASAYITVSRSGETWRPQISASSPVLPITVSELRGTAAARPRRSFAAPVPPAIAVRRMSRGRGFPQRPERAAAAPRVEPRARRAGEAGGQRALRHRDEAVADPYAVEALRPGEQGCDSGRRRVVKRRRHELGRDLERVGFHDHDGAVHHRVAPAPIGHERADQTLVAAGRRERAPGQEDRVGRGPGKGGELEEGAGVPGVRQGAIADPLPDSREP